MRRRTKEDKLVDLLEEILNDHYFHPSLIANIMTTSYAPYTQAKLMELIAYITEYNKKENELHKKTQTAQYRK